MRTYLLIQIFVLSGFLPPDYYNQNQSSDIRLMYKECGLSGVLSYNVFELAMSGLQKINNVKNKRIISIIDFSKPSTQDRLFVIDLENKRLL